MNSADNAPTGAPVSVIVAIPDNVANASRGETIHRNETRSAKIDEFAVDGPPRRRRG